MLVYQLGREVFSDKGLAFSIEILEKRVYKLFSTHLKTHPHLVLEIDLHVVTKIASDVDLNLKWGFDVGKDARLAVTLMVDLCPDVASFRTIVHMLTVFAKFEDWVVLSTIQALRKDISAIPIHHYLTSLQIRMIVLASMSQP